MSNISVGQIIMDAQRMAGRVKDLDALSSALLEEAENNNRLVESLQQFQDDIESLNRISNNKTNADMVNRIQQQNVNSSEILKENRELKICIEDYEHTVEAIMKKYREQAVNKILESKINFKEMYNERLWKIIREQREKISEMAAVMQRAASVDDEIVHRELQTIASLRLENETLRELLQISKKYGSAQYPIYLNDHLMVEKSVQTDNDGSTDDLSNSCTSQENENNNTVVQVFSNIDEKNVSSNSNGSGNTLVISNTAEFNINDVAASESSVTSVQDNIAFEELNKNGPASMENGLANTSLCADMHDANVSQEKVSSIATAIIENATT